MTHPRVSVLMPVFDSRTTLPEALGSIFDQTFNDFEVVAVDDGSSDGSAAILDSWAGRDPRLLVFHEGHRGIIETLNHGLGQCRGEYVARMDADDRMHPERLEKQVAMLDARPEISVAACLVEIVSKGPVPEGMRAYQEWLNGLVSPEEIAREIFVESPIAHPSATFRREEILALGAYRDPGWVEDYDLWLRCHNAGKKFAKVPEVLFYWREHLGRVTRTDPRCSVENFIRAKAHYLAAGPLQGRDALFIWGAGQAGRRLGKHLSRHGWTPEAYIDVMPGKIGTTLRKVPIVGPGEWQRMWNRHRRPLLISAVASRKARAVIRRQLSAQGFVEGTHFICAA